MQEFAGGHPHCPLSTLLRQVSSLQAAYGAGSCSGDKHLLSGDGLTPSHMHAGRIPSLYHTNVGVSTKARVTSQIIIYLAAPWLHIILDLAQGLNAGSRKLQRELASATGEMFSQGICMGAPPWVGGCPARALGQHAPCLERIPSARSCPLHPTSC